MATFSGPNYNGATASVDVTVAPNDVTAAISATPPNPAYGQPVTLQTAIQAKSRVGPNPGGTVTFYDGNQVLRTVPLESGLATLSNYTLLSGGRRSITAMYNGDGVFTTTTSPVLSLTVAPAQSNTTLSVSQSSPSVYGELLDLNVSVTDQSGRLVSDSEKGTVTFRATGSQTTRIPPTQALTNGKASIRAYDLDAGEYNFTAVWSGSTNYSTSTSRQQAFAVSQAAMRTLITGPAPSSSATVGDLVMVTVRVVINPPGGAIQSDTVQVKAQGFDDSICVATLTGAASPFTGSCSFKPTSPGTRQLVAYYMATDRIDGFRPDRRPSGS